jgi:pyridine nucleotide-disulfide oxidoreductase family protein
MVTASRTWPTWCSNPDAAGPPVKRLVLLGAGHAHLHVLEALAAQPMPAAQVTLVSPFAASLYSGMVPGVVAGHYDAAACAIPLAPWAERARVQRVESAAVTLDAATRRVGLADGSSLDYDVLSLDAGATMDRDAIPGAREHAMFVRPIEHFLHLCEPFFALAGERPLSVVVVGGGAGGVELALALQHRLAERARVAIVTGGTPPLPEHPPGVGRRALRALKRLRVTVFEDTCAEITARHVVLGRGTRLECDAPVLAIGASAPAWLRDSGLALDERGFVATGPTLQSTSHPEVFAAGDVSTRVDAPHPKSGVYAVRAGPPLALNLRRFIAGGALEPWLPQRRALGLLSCGDRYAIATWGAWSVEGRWVWWWKDRIDRAFVDRFTPR